MISKPQGDDWNREDRTTQAARQFGTAASEFGGTASRALSAGASAVARGRALYRAFVFGIMACMLGLVALAAGLHDRNVPALLGAGCFSLGLGWLALRNIGVAFGRTRTGAAAFDQEPASDGLASWREAMAASPAACNADISASRGGQVIRYSRAKLVIKAAQAAAVCLLLACVVIFGTHINPATRAIIALVVVYSLWRLTGFVALAADKDLTAIAWDNQQIRVRTLTTSRQVPWQSVESVKSIKRVYRAWGLVPVSSSHELEFMLRHNGSRRRMTLPAAALTMRPGLAEALMTVAGQSRARSAVNAAQAGAQSGAMGRRWAT